MFTISIERYFWISHQLMFADGSQEPLHQHNWSVVVEVGREDLNSGGIVMDFCELKRLVESVLGGDLVRLDQIEYFKVNSQSAESLAKYVYDQLGEKLPNNVVLRSVTAGESSGCRSKYAG